MHRLFRWLAFLYSLAILSCVQPGPYTSTRPNPVPNPGGPALIGTLEVSGAQVFVDGTQAQNGSRVYDGSRVVTNSNSSAIIDFVGGGSVQLDQNTDPVFTLLRQGFCILIEIASGQVFEDTPGQCIQFKTPDGSAQTDTRLNIDLRGGRDVWTLAQGRVRFAPPINYVLRPFEQCTISRHRLIDVRQVSQSELNSITAWRRRYFRVPPVIGYPPPSSSSGYPPPSGRPMPPPSTPPVPPRRTTRPTPGGTVAVPTPIPAPPMSIPRYRMRAIPLATPTPPVIR